MLIGKYIRLERQRKVRRVKDVQLNDSYITRFTPVEIFFEDGLHVSRSQETYVEVFNRKPRGQA